MPVANERIDEDAALMMRVSSGDLRAFETLVERHRLRALNFAFRFLGDREAAEDIAQEAFIRVYQARHRYRSRASFSTWFFRILSNLCLNEIRRRKRREEPLHPESTPATPQPDLSASLDTRYQQQELSAAVRCALAELPDKQRMASILQRYDGLDYDEIAVVMQVSRGAVDGLLSRAKESLRRKLSVHFSQ